MYKVGQKVRVISYEKSAHYFEIGEIVIVSALDVDGTILSAEKVDGSDYWMIDEEEVEPIEEMEEEE